MEKHFNIYADTLVHLTLSLIIENENRYIIDYIDINRFWKTLKENLAKQNIEATKIWDRAHDYDNYGYPVEVYKEDSLYEEYFILYPWSDLKEFVRLYMPFQMKGKWDAESCAQTLESIGMRVVDKFEDYGTIRFHNIQSLYQYFTKVSPDFANVNRYQVFYLQALKEMKDHSYFEMTTHQFLVVAQKTF